MAITLTRAEQETILRWDAEDKRVLIYTADPAVRRKLERQGYALEAVGTHGWRCTAPEGSITIRGAVRKSQKLTEEQRAALSTRLSAARKVRWGETSQ